MSRNQVAESRKKDGFVSYAQAAELTGVSVRTLKRRTQLGELPLYRLRGGNKGYLKKADLLGMFKQVA